MQRVLARAVIAAGVLALTACSTPAPSPNKDFTALFDAEQYAATNYCEGDGAVSNLADRGRRFDNLYVIETIYCPNGRNLWVLAPKPAEQMTGPFTLQEISPIAATGRPSDIATPTPTSSGTETPSAQTTDASGVVHPAKLYSQAEQKKATINSPIGLNVRKGPDLSFDVITNLPDKSPVAVIGQNGDSTAWLYIREGNVTGWVSAQYLVIS